MLFLDTYGPFLIVSLIILRARGHKRLFLTALFSAYLAHFPKQPSLIYHNNLTNQKIVSHLKSTQVRFFPHLLLPNGFAQSFIDKYRPSKIKCENRIYLDLKDDKVVLDIYEPTTPAKSTVLLVHGFNGSSDSAYITMMAYHLLNKKYRVIAFNARGVNTTLNSPVFFHIGWTNDIRCCIDYILKTYDGSLTLIGFSLGGNWVTKLMGEDVFNTPKYDRVTQGIAISLPFDFAKIRDYINKSLLRVILNKYVSNNYKKYFLRHSEIYKEHLNKILECYTVDGIDDLLTLKIFNFQSLDEYYARNSCVSFIPKIRKPLLIVNSLDDPVIPECTIPVEICKTNENVILVLFKKGGHIGFFGNDWNMTSAEKLVIEYMESER
ncbi:Monoacylglycerol lipase ABHD2-A [Astathelohania contejeani]|uniref:Monoacylglycerol lipase ABHD2-A n=1 Tax=Astathelohania contejeani TaxID=164912 RepID=A0ABQ7HZS7_9MICR|nr:Monoacylglycerol lipase ABHD2-A [Thelohania contejeani]